jgi:hypothetical protein
MENLNNLMPFYIGQKIVCIREIVEDWCDEEKEAGCKGPILDKIYSVRGFSSCGGVYLNEIINPEFEYHDSIGEPSFEPKIFRPLQESVFPTLKLTRVIEVEKELISLN